MTDFNLHPTWVSFIRLELTENPQKGGVENSTEIVPKPSQKVWTFLTKLGNWQQGRPTCDGIFNFQDIDYLSRFVVNPPNSKLWSKCFVSMRTLTMVLRWAKWQDWKGWWWHDKKYDGKNVACLRSMFQGWYSFNPEPLSQLSLSYSDHHSPCCMWVPCSASRSHANHIAAPKSQWDKGLGERPYEIWKREWGKSGWQPHSCKEPKKHWQRRKPEPKQDESCITWFPSVVPLFLRTCLCVSKNGFTHQAQNWPPQKKKFALFRAYQPLVSEKIRPY